MKQLFPKEIIEHTVEVHQFAHSNRSKTIYSIFLISILITIASLPFIKIDIYTTARGMLKPSQERITITPLQSGKVTYTNLIDNRRVQKGDTLLITDASILEDNMHRVKNQLIEIKQFIDDCEYLINTSKPKFSHIQSSRYQKEFLYFKQKVQELQTRFEKTKIDYQRNKKLYKKGVIAKVAFQNSVYEHRLASNALKQYQKQQKNNWQVTLTEYQNSLSELEGKIAQLTQNHKELAIIAPIDGILKNVRGITVGSLIAGGVTVAEISPSTEIIAECYLSPTDIGMIGKDRIVNFQVDAFNYNQWGLATGKIIEISKDVDHINNQPVFKVRCLLDQKHLELKNGFKGHLNKGMTISARFQLTERTLFDLLYDKVDDWLNPASPDIGSK
ncbi:HlyD family efflux transporter periplasmic adaptor subunit [Aquimarina sp. 2201CG1-2-11]|uniref:HlyD family secretion protein n=1 Tax=Aquimarina discodermiae TaxID=3231043 RepID=UPI0034623300